MLFIGVQAYILAVASPEKKTQGNAIIVFGFQGGMISGMAIGSLLVNYLNPQGVFVTCAAIGFTTALYSILLIPKGIRHKQAKSALAAAIRRVGSDLAKVSHSGDFLKTMFCIGVPAKAILTGAITFALPLLLGQYGYRQEEIGQIIMLYGIGVVVASAYVARIVDRTGNTEMVLFWGAAISGMGLIFIGLMGSDALGQGAFSTFVVTGGVVTVGVAHGLINAPVVTHVAHSRLAAQIGANSVTTTYRFLERLGHVAGPFLVGQFFLIWGQSARVLIWVGVATAILGILFLVRTAPPRLDAIGPEPAR
jgi:predicted MFS family arabinose efflux permease